MPRGIRKEGWLRHEDAAWGRPCDTQLWRGDTFISCGQAGIYRMLGAGWMACADHASDVASEDQAIWGGKQARGGGQLSRRSGVHQRRGAPNLRELRL